MPLRNIEKEHRQPSLILHLSHPESNNALSLQMAEALQSTIDMMKPQALILTHRGSIFCSGGNLKVYADMKTKEEGLLVNEKIKEILSWLDNLPIPKVAVVDGRCFGGGIELLSCFDQVIATPKSLFGLWQRKMGLSYGWGGGERLERRIAKKRLNQWLFDASLKDVYECRQLGLVDKVVLAGDAIAQAEKWNHGVINLGSESLKAIKGLSESEAFSELWHSEKHKTILKKF